MVFEIRFFIRCMTANIQSPATGVAHHAPQWPLSRLCPPKALGDEIVGFHTKPDPSHSLLPNANGTNLGSFAPKCIIRHSTCGCSIEK